MIQDGKKTKTRREFLKDGMRAALLGGFAFTGIFLGWKGMKNAGKDPGCPVDLPCQSCRKLRDCREPKARAVKLDRGVKGAQ